MLIAGLPELVRVGGGVGCRDGLFLCVDIVAVVEFRPDDTVGSDILSLATHVNALVRD